MIGLQKQRLPPECDLMTWRLWITKGSRGKLRGVGPHEIVRSSQTGDDFQNVTKSASRAHGGVEIETAETAKDTEINPIGLELCPFLFAVYPLSLNGSLYPHSWLALWSRHIFQWSRVYSQCPSSKLYWNVSAPQVPRGNLYSFTHTRFFLVFPALHTREQGITLAFSLSTITLPHVHFITKSFLNVS